MHIHSRLDQLQASIRRKLMVGYDTSRERVEAGQLIRACVPGEAERRVTLHEAGHAVAMHTRGIGTKQAVVDGRSGHAEWGNGNASPRDKIVAVLCGSIAEDGTTANMSDGDRAIIQTQVEQLAPGCQNSGSLMTDLEREARKLVSRHCDAIAETADTLLARGNAQGFEVAGIVAKHATACRSSRPSKPSASDRREYVAGERVVIGRARAVFVARRNTRCGTGLQRQRVGVRRPRARWRLTCRAPGLSSEPS